MIFFFFFFLQRWKAIQSLSRTGRFACLDEAVSVVTSVSEHARALELNPRNIHTEPPYYRGIIQTYLYPSPMTADMTCDRLRYRLHDMPRSLSPPSITISFPHSLQPSPSLSRPSAINFGKRFTRTRRNRLDVVTIHLKRELPLVGG